jgi:hypothetical protein
MDGPTNAHIGEYVKTKRTLWDAVKRGGFVVGGIIQFVNGYCCGQRE